MVYIVYLADAFAKVDEIAYCCKYIVKSDVLGDKVVNSVCKLLCQSFNIVAALIKYLTQYLEANLLVYSESFSIDRLGDVTLYIYHAVAEYLDSLFF